ncbi:hypothetical protein AVEN_268965-1 [Araneus ventricosus]|uniref:Uncharacterized protein n=1 Tax=Araneus ventricosus TaxID=182803 RepID=A0A4Y2I1R9_ARAVE|nr:hypothetical protein AVEN_268965-1 [Araneus ventricosus]
MEDQALAPIARLHLSIWGNMQIEFFSERRVCGKTNRTALSANGDETTSETGTRIPSQNATLRQASFYWACTKAADTHRHSSSNS